MGRIADSLLYDPPRRGCPCRSFRPFDNPIPLSTNRPCQHLRTCRLLSPVDRQYLPTLGTQEIAGQITSTFSRVLLILLVKALSAKHGRGGRGTRAEGEGAGFGAQEKVLATLSKGDSFGELALLQVGLSWPPASLASRCTSLASQCTCCSQGRGCT